MSLGQLLALVSGLIAMFSMLTPMPGWVIPACIVMLAVAVLTSGVMIFRRNGPVV